MDKCGGDSPRGPSHKTSKMKNSRKIVIGLAVMMLAAQTFGQVDQRKMDRDLTIAENILATLSNSENRNIFSSSREIESNYIPGYGVIFSLPQNSLVYTARSKDGIAVISQSGDSYTYSIGSNSNRISEKEEKEREELGEAIEEQLKENMTLFLIDYADLIGQLKPTDRIMVNVKNARNNYWFSGSNSNAKQKEGRTAEILKSDLIALKQGKASREATIDKINFKVNDSESKSRDLELFSSIFGRLYEADMSSTYYSANRTIYYERLDNLGAIFNMKVYSSNEDNGRHRIRTTGEGGLTREERDRKVNEMYPEFEKTLKENILDYGRTIKSLKPSEMLIFKVNLTECRECEMPKEIELSLKASALADFDSGKTNKENALKAFSLKRTEN